MVYKDFKVDNRATVSRNNVHIKVTVPFHSGELPRNTAGDPIADLRQNYSLSINNQIYETAWTEFGAPWFADENNNGGYIRYATAECIVPTFPPGELDGEVVLNQNTEPAYQMHSAVQNALFPNDPNNPSFSLIAEFSGDSTKPARVTAPSGTSAGWYRDQLFPLRNPGQLPFHTTIRQEGLRTLIYAETWLGSEVHSLGMYNDPPAGRSPTNYYPRPFNASTVTGFCHVRFWGEIPSDSSYMRYNIGYFNDKLNAPVNGNKDRSLWEIAYLEGEFSTHFSGDGSVNFWNKVSYNIPNQVATTNTSDGFRDIIPATRIGDTQAWGYKGVVSFDSQAEADREADLEIYGLPTYNTWSGVNGPEYPWPQVADQSVFTHLRNTGRQRYNSWIANNPLQGINPAWEPFFHKLGDGTPKDFGDKGGQQERFGRMVFTCAPFLMANEPYSLDAVSAGNLRMILFRPGHYYQLNYFPVSTLSQPVSANTGAGTKLVIYEHDPRTCYFYYSRVHWSSGNKLGRYKRWNSEWCDDSGINGGGFKPNAWNGMRTQHQGWTPVFMEALITRNQFLIDMLRAEHINLRCATPKYGARQLGDSFGQTASEAGFNATRSIGRSLRCQMQHWLLSNDPTVPEHVLTRIDDVAFGVTGHSDPRVWEQNPGYRNERGRKNGSSVRTPGRDPANGTFGYGAYDDSRRCKGGIVDGGVTPVLGRSQRTSYNVAGYDCGSPSPYYYSAYPARNTPATWVVPPIAGESASRIPRTMFPWQDGMLGGHAALLIRNFGLNARTSGAALVIRDFIETFVDYGSYIPPEPWVWNPGSPSAAGQPRFAKGLVAEYGVQDVYGGPNYAGQDPYGSPNFSHDKLTAWAYGGYKAYTLVIDPNQEPSFYNDAQELVRQLDFVYNFGADYFRVVPDNSVGSAGNYFTADWNWSPGGTVQARGPRVDFTGSPLTGSPPLTVNFTDLTLDSPTSWSWDFDADGNIESTQQNPSYTYTGDGLYSVALTASNASGVTRFVRPNYVLVTSPATPPVVDFTGDPISGQVPLTVQFTDLTTNSPTSWEWVVNQFGTTYRQQNPSHTYTSPGLKPVSLTAINNDGTGRLVRPNYINVLPRNNPPTADFIANPTQGTSPLTVQFQDRSTNNPTSWLWLFGTDDIEFSTEQNPTVTYPNPGTYNVSLRAINQYGEDTLVRNGYITVRQNQTLFADFDASPQVGYAPLTVQFTNLSSPVNSIDLYEWNFGESPAGTVDSTEINPSYTYSSTGQKTVRLTVSNALNSTFNQKNDFIRVDLRGGIFAPVADFTAAPTTGLIPFSVQFTDLSLPAGSPTGWEWNFTDADLDNIQSTERNPVYEYTGQGIYDVALRVSNQAGTSTSVKLQYIFANDIVSNSPDVEYEADAIFGAIPHTIHFEDQTTGNIVAQSWHLTEDYDSVDATGSPVTYVYVQQKALPGYATRLVARNASGILGTGNIPDHINVANVAGTSPDLIYDYSLGTYGNVYVQDGNRTNVKFDNLFTIQPYVLKQSDPDSSFSGLSVYGISGDRRNSILKVSRIADRKARVPAAATMHLYIDNVSGFGDATEYIDLPVNVYRVPWSMEDPTWSGREPGIAWAASGAESSNVDRSPLVLDSFTIPSVFADSSIDVANKRIDVDISAAFFRGIFEDQFGILLAYNHPDVSYTNIGVNFIDEITVDLKYVDINTYTFSGTARTIDSENPTSNITGLTVESDIGYGNAKKGVLSFDLSETFYYTDNLEVAAAYLSVPVAEYSGFHGPPIAQRLKLNTDINTISWSGYSGNSAWQVSGAGSTGDVPYGYKEAFLSPEITGVRSGDYGDLSFKMDSIIYDVTTDIQSMLNDGYDPTTDSFVPYLLSYDTEVLGDTSGYTILGSEGDFYPTLTMAGSFVLGSRPGGAVGVEPGSGTGDQPTLSGAAFSLWLADSNGEFAQGSPLFSGNIYQITGNAEDGGIADVYQKMYFLNDSDAPLFDIKLKMTSEHSNQLFLAYEKEVRDNTESLHSIPSGYVRSDFFNANKPNKTLNFGDLDVSGYTGFWLNVRIPEESPSYLKAWIESSVQYNTIVSKI